MTQKPTDYGREVRDTIVKSSLTGVAATVLAVTIFSPQVLGGMIGTSLASGNGLDPNASSADDPYANLPPYPTPLTGEELAAVQSQLARSIASLEITRAATDAKIDYIRTIAASGETVSFEPIRTAQADDGLRSFTAETQTFAAAVPAPAFEAAPASVEVTIPASAAAAPVEAVATPVSFTGGVDPAFRDPHLELADLLLADSF